MRSPRLNRGLGLAALAMLLLPLALAPTSAGLLLPDVPPVLEEGLPTLPGPIGDVIGPIPHPLCNKVLPVDEVALPVPSLLDAGIEPVPIFRWDYGDAPDSSPFGGPMPTYYTPFGSPTGFFPTQANTANEWPAVAQAPGARHRIVGVGWLGNIAAYGGPGNFPRNVGADLRPTLEKDAIALPDEDGIVNLQGNTPDHDGRDDGVYPAAFPAGAFGALTFRVTAASAVNQWYVNALADWNFNGRWGAGPAGPPEWIVVNMPVSVPAGQSWTFTSPPFATGFIAGTPWIRVTLSDKPVPAAPYGANGWDGSTPPGITTLGQKGFQCGETEDYCGLLFLVPHQGQEMVRCPREQTNPECQGQQSYARILNVTTNGQPPVPGFQGTSPYSNNTGLIFKAELVNATGLLAQVRHHCVRQLTISLVKVPPIPAGTSPAGTKFTTTLFPTCPLNALHNQAIPGGNLDRGEYDLVVSWNGCFTGSGSATQRIILV